MIDFNDLPLNGLPTNKDTNNERLKQVILSKTSEINIYGYILNKYYPNQKISLGLKIPNIITGDSSYADSFQLFKDKSGQVLFSDEFSGISGDCFDCWCITYHYTLQDAIAAIDSHLNLGFGLVYGLPKISFFNKPIQNVHPDSNCNLLDIYHKIKSPLYYSTATQHYRALIGTTAKQFKTSELDFVCFSGSFSERRNVGLKKHSGLICIDFDHVQDIDTMKKNLLNDKELETGLLFVSPSGKGLKWVVKIEALLESHTGYFNAIQNYLEQVYGYTLDKSGKDIARACFLCHDPEVYIDPNYLQNHYHYVE